MLLLVVMVTVKTVLLRRSVLPDIGALVDINTLTLRSQLSSVATVYQSIRVVENNDATKILSANASFPLKLGRGKHFDLSFQGEGNVVISRAAEESEDSTVNVLVESTWSNEEAEGVEMMSGEHSHALSVIVSC